MSAFAFHRARCAEFRALAAIEEAKAYLHEGKPDMAAHCEAMAVHHADEAELWRADAANDDLHNVVEEDKPWPTKGPLFADIPGPLVVPVCQEDSGE